MGRSLDQAFERLLRSGKTRKKAEVCAGLTFFAAHEYVSPRDRQLSRKEAWVREISYALKKGSRNEVAVRIASRAMAPLVERGSVLVPIPSSSGSVLPNLRLAKAIAQRTGSVVVPAIARRHVVEASHLRRRRGLQGLTLTQQRSSLLRTSESMGGNVVFVDNVATTGTTVKAACAVLKPEDRAEAVVWAQLLTRRKR